MPAAKESPPGPKGGFLSAAAAIFAGALVLWPSPLLLPLGWGRFLLGLGLLSMAGSLLGSPLRVHRRDLDERTEEAAYQVAPSAALALLFAVAGLFLLPAGEGEAVALGPSLLALALVLLSHGAAGGFFFKVVRRKPR